MKSKVLGILILLSGVFCHEVFAIDATDNHILTITLNLNDAEIFGLSEEEFHSYYSGAFHKPENYTKLIFKRFINKFESAFNEIPVQDTSLSGILNMKIISEKGGYSGVLKIFNKFGESVFELPISINDGRWNDFEQLFYENAQIGGMQARQTIEKSLDVMENRHADANTHYKLRFKIFAQSRETSKKTIVDTFEKDGITILEAESIIAKYKVELDKRGEKNPNYRYFIKYEIAE